MTTLLCIFRVGERWALADTYATWKASVFTATDQANAAVSGETANPSGDGVPNLMKYALGLNPYQYAPGSGPAFSLATQGGQYYPALTYPTPAVDPPTDLLYVPETSPDLVTWSSGSSAVSLLQTTGPANGLYTSTYIASAYPVGSNIKAFMRLQVTQTATISAASGTFNLPQTITITGPAGATFYYTTDGTTPTTASNLYEGPFSISYSQAVNLLVQAYVNGVPYGGVVVSSYTINTPTLTLISGNNQSASPYGFLSQPLVIEITDSNSNPLPNAPVTFSATTGSCGFSSSAGGVTSQTLAVNSNASGLVTVYVEMPSTPNAAITFTAAAGASQVLLTAQTTAAVSGTLISPTQIVATVTPSGNTDVHWLNNDPTATGNVVERSTDSVNWQFIGSGTAADTDFTDTSSNGTTYYYRVTAVNSN